MTRKALCAFHAAVVLSGIEIADNRDTNGILLAHTAAGKSHGFDLLTFL